VHDDGEKGVLERERYQTERLAQEPQEAWT
jgi:hypothetical protein